MENKMEEELRREEKEKNKIGLYIVAGVFLLLIVFVITFRTLYSRDNNEGNTPIINDSTLSDDTTASDDKTDTIVDKKGNELYIYQKGYSDMAPIAFTYECKSENCSLYTTDKGFVLYDEDKVQYREMTQYEYEQINNSDKSPNGEKLELDGFVEVKPEEIYDKKYNLYHKIYIIENNIYELYISEEDEIKEFSPVYNAKEEDVDADEYYYDNLIVVDGVIYDYEKKQIIWNEGGYISASKIGDFYVFYVANDEEVDIIFDKNYNVYLELYSSRGYYINDDKIYYIDDMQEVKVLNTKNEQIEYDNDGITALSIDEEYLFYLDSKSKLCAKNLNTLEDFMKTDEILDKEQVVQIYNYGEGTKIRIPNGCIIYNDDFNSIKNEIDISDSKLDEMKNEINKNNCLTFYSSDYTLGYELSISSDGEIISKDYYFEWR